MWQGIKQSIMAELRQDHIGPGDNVGRDKFVTYNINGQVRQIPQLLTSIPRFDAELIGREEEMKNLAEVLEPGKKVILVNGIGGVGKTTLAMAYTNQNLDKYTHVAWVEQFKDLPTSLLANPVLLKNLDFSPGGDAESDAKILLNQLANLDGKSLLIIENATENLTRFKDDLPRPPKWHVLITSREQLDFAQMMGLDLLTEDNALKLLFEHYKIDRDPKAAKEIVALVDGHTLTIELLAKMAQERMIQPLSKFSDQLKEEGLKINRKMSFPVFHSKNQKIEKLFPYLSAIFEWHKASPEEEHLLKQFVVLPPILVPLDTIVKLLSLSAEKEEDWDNFTTALKSLLIKGWIQGDQERQEYKMHRIIRDVLRQQLVIEFSDIKNLIKGISAVLLFDPFEDNPAEKTRFIPFATFLLENAKPWNQVEEVSSLKENLARVFLELGLYEDAKTLYESILNTLRPKKNANAWVVAACKAALAYSLINIPLETFHLERSYWLCCMNR